MNVNRVSFERVHDFRQREVVRCHNPDGIVFDKLPNYAFRTNSTIVRVRSLQDFVQQKGARLAK